MSDSDPVTPQTPAPAEEPATAPAVPTSAPETDPAKDPTQDRIGGFIEAYGALVKEHGIDFASYPVFMPNGRGGFDITVQNTPVDVKNQPVKSPFMA